MFIIRKKDLRLFLFAAVLVGSLPGVLATCMLPPMVVSASVKTKRNNCINCVHRHNCCARHEAVAESVEVNNGSCETCTSWSNRLSKYKNEVKSTVATVGNAISEGAAAVKNKVKEGGHVVAHQLSKAKDKVRDTFACHSAHTCPDVTTDGHVIVVDTKA